MIRIAVSGAHGVGKTTLIRELGRICPETRIVGNVMRSLAKAGYAVGANTTPRTLSAYLEKQLAQEEKAFRSGRSVLSDRIFVDGAAYIIAAHKLELSEYGWSEDLIELIKSIARLHALRYNRHVYVPIEFPLQSEDPLNVHGGRFQRAVDEALRSLLVDDWPVPLLEVRGTIVERAETVADVLREADG